MADYEIGVVVPTWNSAKTLDWTLCSLRHQVNCDVKIIVADSGSKDATLDICKNWGAEVVYEPPGSMYRAINTGMKHLTNKWVTYLNSDDLAYGDAYYRLIAKAESESADVAYGDCDYIDDFGRFLFPYQAAKPQVLLKLARAGGMGFAQPAAVYRKDLVDQLEGFRSDFRHISDYDFFRRALEAGKKFASIGPPAVVAFRLIAEQLHHKEKDIVNKEQQILRDAGAISSNSRMPSLTWRASNWRNYIVRVLRRGSLRMR